MRTLGALASALAIVFVACGGDPSALIDPAAANAPTVPAGSDGGAPNPGTAGGLPCDVDAVLKERCQTCHAAEPKFGASAPLATVQDLQKVGAVVKQRVHDDTRPMPPSPKERLTAQESAILDAWIDGGMKPSSDTCTNAPSEPGVKPLSCTPDTTLRAAKPFTMPAGGPVDQYTCFGAEMTLQKKKHIVGLAPKIDNAKIVHHVLLFQSPTAVSPDPFACAAFGSASWKLVAGWAPGGTNLELPPEAGFPANVGSTHWVVQVHYNNTQAQSGTDLSGYDLCTTETLRQHDAGVLAFGSTSFSIPPRSTRNIRCDYRLGAQFNNVKLFNASPHMHTRGVSMSTERLVGGSGTPEMIFEQKNFSFEAQANYPITKAVEAGDVMRTRCGWKNPSDATIGFGEGTGDEMCFDFIGYYPNIPDLTIAGVPLFSWVTPSLTAACTNE